jgi:hypothetical protein
MTDIRTRTPDEKQNQNGSLAKGKKLYQKPAFRYERVFETAALTCGKVLSGLPNCNSA